MIQLEFFYSNAKFKHLKKKKSFCHDKINKKISSYNPYSINFLTLLGFALICGMGKKTVFQKCVGINTI